MKITPTPTLEAPKTYFIDCDSLFAIVESNVDNLTNCAARFGIETDVIHEARAYAQARPNTPEGLFDPLSLIERTLPDNDFTDLIEDFINPQPQDRSVLYENESGPFIDSLQQREIPHSGLTHGKNILWQYSKFTRAVREARANGYGNGHLYVEVINGGTAKGPHIAETHDTDSTIPMRALSTSGLTLAIIRARGGVLVDDRNYSFRGLDGHDTGYHVTRSETAKRAVAVDPELHDRVHAVPSLNHVDITGGLSTSRALPGTASLDAVAYAPAYMNGNAKRGLLITPHTTAQELRDAADQFKS